MHNGFNKDFQLFATANKVKKSDNMFSTQQTLSAKKSTKTQLTFSQQPHKLEYQTTAPTIQGLEVK